LSREQRPLSPEAGNYDFCLHMSLSTVISNW
jgi:hypothetical protein